MRSLFFSYEGQVVTMDGLTKNIYKHARTLRTASAEEMQVRDLMQPCTDRCSDGS